MGTTSKVKTRVGQTRFLARTGNQRRGKVVGGKEEF